MRIGIFVPVYNPGREFHRLLTSIQDQEAEIERIVIVDSSTNGESLPINSRLNAQIIRINNEDFDHGGTRNKGVAMLPEVEILVFLTQDACLSDKNSIWKLVQFFEDKTVGAVYGRQLPHANANPEACHARLFNYPPEDQFKTLADVPRLGIKTAFISNSFAAYRRSALQAVGGFPRRCILSEDTYVAAKMLLAGWQVAYCSEAKIYHSHNYSYLQEFRRYFDLGVFHSRESWIRGEFGQAEGEGVRYLISEIRFLWPKWFYLVPSSLFRCLFKYVGFKIGHFEAVLPLWLKMRLSMNRRFWDSER